MRKRADRDVQVIVLRRWVKVKGNGQPDQPGRITSFPLAFYLQRSWTSALFEPSPRDYSISIQLCL